MAVEYLDKGNDDGTCLGQSATEKISFYGATTIVQPSGAGQAVISSDLTALATGAAVSTCVSAINAINVLLLKIRTDLVALGLVKGSA